MTDILKQLHSDVFNKHVPPGVMSGHPSIPVHHLKFAEFTGQEHECYSYNLRLPLEAQGCAQTGRTGFHSVVCYGK